MELHLVRYLLALFLILPINGTNLGENGTVSESREPKANRRIVRLYSGTRPKPIVCLGEGFQPDPTDCTIFHRCMKNGNGRYVSFKFQCGPGTIYDPESEGCNHPERTRRTDCGRGNTPIFVPNVDFDNDISKEIPSPISTKGPSSTQKTSETFPFLFTTHRADISTLVTKYPWVSTSHQYAEPNLSTLNPWASSKWQDSKATKTPPTKRQINELSSTPSTPAWMSTQRPTTPRLINRQTTQTGDICTTEGFMGDSENCRKFYRCINNQRGGFIRYEFMCSDPTIWDDEKQACNHAWSVKRRRCGRGSIINDSNGDSPTNHFKSVSSTETIPISKPSPSSQSQLQINYGSKVTQTQTQISNNGPVIQNQTQINYGGGSTNSTTKNPSVLQNQTQISHGDAVSQTQTQINYGDKAVQTQLQIDHSKDSSQAQSQISESTSTTRSTQHHDSQSMTNTNSNNVCTESGFIGDSSDCKKFYRCVDNGRGGFTRYEFSCGEGTVWDPKLEACNHAWAVKECGDKAPSQSNTQSSVKTTESTSKSTVTTSAFTTSSSSTTQSYYSPTEDEDNDIPYGNQPSSSKPSKPSTVPQQGTSTTKAPQSSNNNDCKSSGFMGDSTDCKKFYRCVDNGNGGYTRYEFSCGEGTVWDKKIEACNHAWAVENCGGTSVNGESSTTITTTTTSTSTTSKPSPQYDDYDTGYGSQNDEPNSSSSSVTTTTIKSTTTMHQSSQSSDYNYEDECTSSGFMGDSNDCKKFYRCVDDGHGGYTRYEFSCGEGTVWDPKIQSCNHAWAVEKCGGNSAEDISKVETTTRKNTESTSIVSSSLGPDPDDVDDPGYGQTNEPQQSTSTRPQHQSNEKNECQFSGFMGDNNDCKKFYRCVDNGDGTYTRYEFSCGEGTVWDAKIEACNHAWAVEKCGGASLQPSTTKPTQTSSNDEEYNGGSPVQSDEYSTPSTVSTASSSSSTTTTVMTIPSGDNECKSSGFMGDSTDCKRFYRCVDNGQGGFTRYEFSCGEGTMWDQSIDACNHDWAVKGHCSQTGTSESINSQSTTQKPDYQENNQLTTQIVSTSHPSTSHPPTDTPGNQCTHEGFYGDKNNCKNFYRCVDNGQGGYTKYEFTCGEGTVWNQEIQACDHESGDKKCNIPTPDSTQTETSNANDQMLPESTTKEPTSSTTTSENDTTTQIAQSSNNKCESEGFYGDSNNCKKFYRCVDDGKGSYTKYEFTCGEGTVWDQEILACNHETSDKKCFASVSGTSTSISSSETESSTHHIQEQHTTLQPDVTNSGPESDQCETDGFFANSNDCKKFYRCVSDGKGGFTKYDFSCGEGTVWVQEIQACDFDNDISSCSSKNNNSTQTQTTLTQQSTTTVSTDQSTTQSQESDKDNDEYPSESTSKPMEENENCKSEGFFANQKDCTRFYRCVDNGQGGYTKYDFTCGEGTAWDNNLQTCNHINEVESCESSNEQDNASKPINDEESSQSPANTSTTKGSDTSTESSKPQKTDQCEQEGFYGDSQDCKKFYRCVDNGKGGFTKYDFTCGEGTIWDQDLTTCNHPQDVVNPSCTSNENTPSSTQNPPPSNGSGTTSSSSTQGSQSTTESSNQGSSNCSQESSTKEPANQNVKCDKAGFYPNPDDCKKFYRCVDWDGNGERFSVYHFECGEGTIWDPQLETCNHEDSVYPPRDCSGTQTQNQTAPQETTTTEKATDTTESSTTTQSTTDESTTTQQSSTTEKTTTTEKTSSVQTTQESTTETQTTSSEKTTEQSTTEQTTTESTTTTQKQTTQESTTTQQSTSSEQTTSSENTTTEQSTTTEQTTTQQSTTSEQTTTQQSTTSEQTTTQQSTTSEETTTQQSTSEQTTIQQSTTSEQTTSEATTQSSSSEQTTQQPSNTSDTTTTEQSTTTTEQSSESNSTTENTTEQQATTTESSTTTTTESNESTTTENDQGSTTEESSTSDKECPETDDDQYMYVCPTSFRRHPKYCNMFYQCTEDEESHEVKIATFKCPNNTIYDESQTQCVEEDKADKKCNGQIARKYRVKRRNSNFKEPIEVARNKQACSGVGFYPFEKGSECSGGFLKCQKTKSGKLRGYVHRCPDGYTYWSISKRCEKDRDMKFCKQSINTWKDRWEIPVEKNNIAK